MKIKDCWEDGSKEVYDTRSIQIKSLHNFMNELKYSFNRFCGVYVLYSDFNRNPYRVISPRTAILLHNESNNSIITLKGDCWKYVKRVKLQWNNKNKNFIVQSHKVEFTKKAYTVGLTDSITKEGYNND